MEDEGYKDVFMVELVAGPLDGGILEVERIFPALIIPTVPPRMKVVNHVMVGQWCHIYTRRTGPEDIYDYHGCEVPVDEIPDPDEDEELIDGHEW